MEVAQISRDLARTLKLNEDLAESIALAHDLGHTPFGHVGEQTLTELLKPYNLKFEHNLQSKYIVEKLEKKYPDFDGLNLTYEVLEGLAKHESIYDHPAVKNAKNSSLEAQIVNIADEIAYNAHDTDDGLRSEILKIKELKKIKLWPEITATIPTNMPSNLFRGQAVSNLIGAMITDLITETSQRLKEQKIKTLADIQKCEIKIARFSKNFLKKIIELRQFLLEKLYRHPDVIHHSARGQNIIQVIFAKYMSDSLFLPLSIRELITKTHPRPIVVKDYLSGMTDSFARAEFDRLKNL